MPLNDPNLTVGDVRDGYVVVKVYDAPAGRYAWRSAIPAGETFEGATAAAAGEAGAVTVPAAGEQDYVLHADGLWRQVCPDFVAAYDYSAGAFITDGGVIYRRLAAGTSGASFAADIAQWEALGSAIELDSVRVLTSVGPPLDGTTTAWFVDQLLLDVLGNNFYRATTASTDPDTAATGSVWAIDESDRVHAEDSDVAPAVAGAPTAAEFEAWAVAQGWENQIAYYTGDDLPASAPTYVVHIDASRNATILQSPSAGGNIYDTDGTLTGARTVTMGTDDITLSGVRETVLSPYGLPEALNWRQFQQGFFFGAGTFTPDIGQYGDMNVGIAATDVGDLTIASPTTGGVNGSADRYTLSFSNVDTVARNIVFDAHYQDRNGAAIGTQVVQPSSTRYFEFWHQTGAVPGSFLDHDYSAAVANDLAHLTDTAVSPTVTGLPTLAEIQAAVTAASLTDVTAYYNGSNTPDPAAAEGVYAVDGLGVAIEINNIPLTDLSIRASRWGTTNADAPIQVEAGINNSYSTRLTDNSATDAGYYSGPGAAPTSGTQYVRVRVADVGTPGHGFAVQTSDFASSNLATAVMNPFDGSTAVAQTGAAVAPSIVSTTVRDEYIEWVLAFTGYAGALTWRLYPAYSDAAALGTEDVSRTDSIDLLDIDWDYDYTPLSAAVATVIDSSGAPVAEVLPAATGSGAILFYSNEDVTNTATLAPASGEQLNGVVDKLFYFSNYSAGTQFRADDIGPGQWFVSVVGQAGVTPRNEVAIPATEVTLAAGATTLVYNTDPAGGEVAAYDGYYFDEGSTRHVFIPIRSDEDALVTLEVSSNVIPAGASIESLSAWTTEQFGGATNEDWNIGVIEGATNQFFLNRVDTAGDQRNWTIYLQVKGAAAGQTVLAGMVTPTTLDYVYIKDTSGNSATATAPTGGAASFNFSESGVTIFDPSGLVSVADNEVTIGQTGIYRLLLTGYQNAQAANLEIHRNGGGLASISQFSGTETIGTSIEWTGALDAGDIISFHEVFGVFTNIRGFTATVHQLPTGTIVSPDALVPTELALLEINQTASTNTTLDLTKNRVNWEAPQLNTAAFAFADGKVTLPAGRTFRLRAHINTLTREGRYFWDFTGDALIGSGFLPEVSETSGSSIEAIFTPTVDSDVGVVLSSTATIEGGAATGLYGSGFIIQELPAYSVVAWQPDQVEATALERAVIRLSGDWDNIVGNNVWQTVEFDTATLDSAAAFDVANFKYVVPSDGDYHTDLVISYVNNSTPSDDAFDVAIRLNGSSELLMMRHNISELIGTTGGLVATLSGVLPGLVAGDELTVEAFDIDNVITTVADSSSWSIQRLPTTEVVTPGDVPVTPLSSIVAYMSADENPAGGVDYTNFTVAGEINDQSGGATWDGTTVTVAAGSRAELWADLTCAGSAAGGSDIGWADSGGNVVGRAAFNNLDGENSQWSAHALVGPGTYTLRHFAGNAANVHAALTTTGRRSQLVLKELPTSTVVDPGAIPVTVDAPNRLLEVGGIMFQSGRVTADTGAGSQTITFPSPFKTGTSPDVVVTAKGNSAASEYVRLNGDPTETSANVYRDSTDDSGSAWTSADSIYWIAIGETP